MLTLQLSDLVHEFSSTVFHCVGVSDGNFEVIPQKLFYVVCLQREPFISLHSCPTKVTFGGGQPSPIWSSFTLVLNFKEKWGQVCPRETHTIAMIILST